MRKIKLGEDFLLAEGKIKARLQKKKEAGICQVEFFYEGDFFSLLQQVGKAPLPPYILKAREKKEQTKDDKNRYQTIYAEKYGSVAAPTAGLHFDKKLLLKMQKISPFAFVSLHIGLGTFEKIECEDIREHKMHKEYFKVEKKEAQKILQAKEQNKKILAIGTTSMRSLESISSFDGEAILKTTDLFIYPPYSFQNVDYLLTNFHLPKSSLFILIAAFCGLENTQKIYQSAIKNNYRFFSYGDCMLIL